MIFTSYPLLDFYLYAQLTAAVASVAFCVLETLIHGFSYDENEKSHVKSYLQAIGRPRRWTWFGLISAILFPAFLIGFLTVVSLARGLILIIENLNKPVWGEKVKK